MTHRTAIPHVVMALFTATALGAQTRERPPDPVAPHEAAEEAIGQLRSPFCPGLMLEVCPTPNAEALRDSIRSAAHEGASSDSLVSMVLAKYGEKWRALPKKSGTGLLAWVIPPAALVLGAIGVVMALRALRRRPGDVHLEEAAPISDSDRDRLDKALRAFEESDGVSL